MLQFFSRKFLYMCVLDYSAKIPVRLRKKTKDFDLFRLLMMMKNGSHEESTTLTN